MRRFRLGIVGIGVGLMIFNLDAAIGVPAPIPLTGTGEVFFSPHGGATTVIVKEINAARNEVLVQAYSFTSAPIAKALLEAKKRGVNVVVILDKSQRTGRYSSGTFIVNTGIPVWIDALHGIAHNNCNPSNSATYL